MVLDHSRRVLGRGVVMRVRLLYAIAGGLLAVFVFASPVGP